VRGLAPAHLPGAPEDLPRLRDGGTYLVTGGLGGFGRTFAEMLAREHGARLVLLGRSELPPREEWDEILESGTDSRTARKIESVRELEALGAEVMVEAADVTDPASLGDVVRRTRGRFGPIHGVIHAAGVPGGGMIQLKERDAAAAVLAPKVAGTYALEAALAGESLDFLLLCSSTIAVLGGFGQVDYCAANNFLDAYARSRAGANGGGTYTVSVNWGAWKEVGMAVETALPAGAAQAGVGSGAGKAAANGAGGGTVLEPFDGPSLHPLLDRRIDDGTGRAVFAVRPGPDSHWVLDEHRIQGRPAIPGTTYLEMVRAAFAEAEGVRLGFLRNRHGSNCKRGCCGQCDQGLFHIAFSFDGASFQSGQDLIVPRRTNCADDIRSQFAVNLEEWFGTFLPQWNRWARSALS
jgi:NAD(P)-dependent dehydrogenase (short-subunit alcohol dehydrogenase family)